MAEIHFAEMKEDFSLAIKSTTFHGSFVSAFLQTKI